MLEFGKHGRGIFGEVNLEQRIAKAARAAMSSLGSIQQARAYSTSASGVTSTNSLKISRRQPNRKYTPSSRSYATASTMNPNPPFGTKNASNQTPAKVALIGARGYTGTFTFPFADEIEDHVCLFFLGQALINLLNNHPVSVSKPFFPHPNPRMNQKTCRDSIGSLDTL